MSPSLLRLPFVNAIRAGIARTATNSTNNPGSPCQSRLAILCLLLCVVLGAGRASAWDEDTCKTIKLGAPLGPGTYTYEACVPEEQCVAKYAEHAYCQKEQRSCSGHCENFESDCYALDDQANKGVTSAAVAGKACKLFIGTGGQHKKIDGVLCTFTTVVAAGGRLGCHCECGQGYAVPIAVSYAPLPEGAIYATATVEPDSGIQIEQPGYAVIATADVVTAKRVNPGDHLDAKTISSIAFDDGTGLIIKTLKKSSVPLEATVGSTSLLTPDHPQPLPLQNGSSTVYVGSDKPFVTPAVAINNVNKLPETTHAVVLNSNGEKVGALATFKGLPGNPSGNITIRTLDSSGSTLQQGNVAGGSLNATPMANFDKPVYKAGEKGRLLIQNQSNYQAGIAMTRFGGAANLSREPIRIIPLSDITGLPAEAPFATTSLNCQAVHAGEARVAVIFPRALPPKLVQNPGNDEGLKRANAAFQAWLSQVER